MCDCKNQMQTGRQKARANVEKNLLSVHWPELETDFSFSKAIPHFYTHIPIGEEFPRKRCRKKYTGYVFYRTAQSFFLFTERVPALLLKMKAENSGEEKVFLGHGPSIWALRLLRKKAEGKAIIFILSLRVPDIGKDKRSIGKSARRHHPKCFKSRFWTFINHQKYAMLNSL